MESIKDIAAEMRKDMPRVVDAKVILRNYADRIEAAHKREADSIHHAMVILAGIEMEDSANPPRLWTALEDAYDALSDALGTDGDTTADVEEAKASGRHFVVRALGDAAKMREALKYLKEASREFCHLILNSKYNAVFDKYKYPEVAKIRDAIANAGVVLAEPPRNCDLLRNSQEALVAIHNDRDYVKNPIDERRLTVDWLLAEAKGETK